MSIQSITAAKAGIAHAHTALATAVQEARTAGATWEAIGAALGVSKSAASHRFATANGGVSAAEAHRQRLDKARVARINTAAFKAAGKTIDRGLTAAAAAKTLGVDARTVRAMGASVRERLTRRIVRMPSGTLRECYFLD